MTDDLVNSKAAIIPCIWDNDGQQYVPVYSHRGVEITDRIEQLEAALRQIASCKSYHSGDIVDIARAALEGKKDD